MVSVSVSHRRNIASQRKHDTEFNKKVQACKTNKTNEGVRSWELSNKSQLGTRHKVTLQRSSDVPNGFKWISPIDRLAAHAPHSAFYSDFLAPALSKARTSNIGSKSACGGRYEPPRRSAQVKYCSNRKRKEKQFEWMCQKGEKAQGTDNEIEGRTCP